jgi:excisionase family DNA binding protein
MRKMAEKHRTQQITPGSVRNGVESEAAERQPAKKQPDYWIASEVSELLRLSEKSIYRIMRADATFPFVKVGRGSVRFPRERLLKWLRDNEQGRGAQRHVPRPA